MANTNAALRLDYAGHGQASGWRRGEDLIDALPYIDPLTPEVKKQVDRLIEEELSRGNRKPSDFLKEMPPVPPSTFDGHPLLATEYERVKSKTEMPPLDSTRYMLNPPGQTRRNDVGEWKRSLDNASAQLEHQYLRILNLELMLKYGDKVWRAQTQLDESLVHQYEAELAETKRKITQLNTERKLQQTAAGLELRKIEEEYYALVQKNFEIETASSRLDDEITSLSAQLQARQGGAATAATAPPDTNGSTSHPREAS